MDPSIVVAPAESGKLRRKVRGVIADRPAKVNLPLVIYILGRNDSRSVAVPVFFWVVKNR
jgi:hypothetical protein